MLNSNYTVVDLARDAHELDLRNRVVPASDTIDWAQRDPTLCANAGCDSILTIVDRGPVCRQCRLDRSR